jgi:hypothetical protein
MAYTDVTQAARGEGMSEAQPERERCQAYKVNGQPCTAPAVRNGHCIGHQGAENVEWRKAGGAATSNANRAAKLLPSRLQPIERALESVFAHLYHSTGEFRSARDATALATVALGIGRLFEIGEREQRLRDLEASVEEWQQSAERDRNRWPA